jgi:hypothetical protein
VANLPVLLAAGLLLSSPATRADQALPTHCKQSEFSFLDARIHLDKASNPDARTSAGKTEKILSLCADSRKEPLTRLVYRFGAIGDVEIELIAAAENKAGLSTQSDSDSHAGLISIAFHRGPYTYEVGEGMGMTSGVRLIVQKSGKLLLDVRSDVYESELIHLNFDKASSPVFRIAKPMLPW